MNKHTQAAITNIDWSLMFLALMYAEVNDYTFFKWMMIASMVSKTLGTVFIDEYGVHYKEKK